jgi:hypothetical protein
MTTQSLGRTRRRLLTAIGGAGAAARSWQRGMSGTRGDIVPVTRRARFRAWRLSRPFSGGLLLLLAGLELLLIPLMGNLGHGAIKLVIYVGIGGVFGVLIGLLLIAAGIMLWVNPVHRVFYGIAGIALGIVSFPASNLGGFFIGMLLAIVGGSIGFAWAPVEQGADAGESAEPAQP